MHVLYDEDLRPQYVFSIIFFISFILSIVWFPPPGNAQEDRCNDILYAPLYNKELVIEKSVENDYFRNAMCSMSDDEFRSYRHQDEYEYEKYCSMTYREFMSKTDVKTRGKIFGIGSAGADVTVEKFEKWKTESCSESSKRSILTTEDFRRYKKQNCTDLTRKRHRDSFRYHFQRLTNIDARIEAWSICMKGPPSKVENTILRCWVSPEATDELVKLNIYWWRLGKSEAEVERWILLGGDVIEGGVFPGILPKRVIQNVPLKKGKTSYLISRHKKKDLNVLLNISIEDYRIDCDVFLPKPKPKPPVHKCPAGWTKVPPQGAPAGYQVIALDGVNPDGTKWGIMCMKPKPKQNKNKEYEACYDECMNNQWCQSGRNKRDCSSRCHGECEYLRQ